MPRLARIVLPGVPHHVTHRGNRRDDVFFCGPDRQRYLEWLAEYSLRYGLRIWAYCLMTNHVHLLAVPEQRESLAQGIGRTQMQYARWINRRRGWDGHLWANRFYSCPVEASSVACVAKYIELNPVRAGLVHSPEEYPWSSARAHCSGAEDDLLAPERRLDPPSRDWATWLRTEVEDLTLKKIRTDTATGRPTGSDEFVARLEAQLDRRLSRRKYTRENRRLHE